MTTSSHGAIVTRDDIGWSARFRVRAALRHASPDDAAGAVIGCLAGPA